MFDLIVEALKNSLIPHSQTVKKATDTLNSLAKTPNYCVELMKIADNSDISIPIKQGALIQLKNTIKKYWSATSYSICEEEKQTIMGNLVMAFIRSSHTFQLIKLYREVVSAVIGFEHKRWIPIDDLLGRINNNQNLPAVLHFMQAIGTNFQFSLDDEERQYYYEYLKHIFPTLFSLFQRNQNPQIIYLLTKIIWKAVHYQISDQLRNIICNWMGMVLTIVGAKNDEFQMKFEEVQERGTSEFFYFHSKKWATRILYRFIFRHAKADIAPLASEEVKTNNREFSKRWYEAYGQQVIETIVNQFQVPCIKKVRFFQLKCITGLIEEQPEFMKSYADYFQYQVLLPYLKLTQEDQELVNNDPVEFLNSEIDNMISYTNLKKAATHVWVTFCKIGMKKSGMKRKPGQFFFSNMNFLKGKLESQNMVEKQMAMYLICELRSHIIGCQQLNEIVPKLVAEFIIPEFQSEVMFLKARAAQIFSQYGTLDYPENVIKKAVQGIYFCLTGDQPLVKIKAASAFHCLMRHQSAKKLVEPLLQNILEVYIDLLEKYDLQILVQSLESIVENFSLEICPYALNLVSYLAKHFIKLYHRDNDQSKNEDYDGETELAAAGVLAAIKTIVEAPVQREKINQMEADILGVCEFVFASDDSDYIEDALAMLKAYTHKVTVISDHLLFYYSLCIYYVNGVKKDFWVHIENLNLPEINKKNIFNLKSGCNIEALESVMPVLRNFISQGSELLLHRNDPFGINLMQLMFQMVDNIYKKGPDEFDGEVEMNSCTVLMIYLIENNYQKLSNDVIRHVWQVAKFNFFKAKSKSLTSLNIQLACVMLWSAPIPTLALIQEDNLLLNFLNRLLHAEPHLKEEHQRQRVILGSCSLLAIKQRPNDLYNALPKIFKLVTELVSKNAEARINEDDENNFVSDSDEDELQDFGHGEPEDIWEEDYENNYSGKLVEVDEVKYFRDCMQYLQKEQPSLYTSLMELLPKSELTALEERVTKAIQMLEQIVDDN